jgi:YD repeat-containing protein
MAAMQRLLLSGQLLTLVQEHCMILGSQVGGSDRIQATRDASGSYAFVYTASGKPVTVNLNKLSGSTIDVRWYDVRNPKKTIYVGQVAKSGNRTFTPPTAGAGKDWVLVLDDAAKKYGKP